MSKLKFCPECGAKLEYSFAPPKFCSNCGSSISRAPAVETHAQRPKASDDDEVDYVPKIEKLEASIEFDDNVTTLGFNEKEGFVFKRKKFEKRSTQF